MLTVLLTGATGVVGSAVLAEPAESPLRVIALTRSGTLPPGAAELANADIALPHLGLDAETRRRLARRVDVVVHAAGATSLLSSDRDRFHRVNVQGTAHVMEFAAAADAPVVLVSSISAGLVESAVTPDPAAGGSTLGWEYLNAYGRSKLESEQVARSYAHPLTIVRTSTFLGDSRTGRINRSQAIHMVLSGLLTGTLPPLQITADHLCDLVPQDIAARFLLAAAEARVAEASDEHRLYWVTAGPNRLTFADLQESCDRVAAEAGLGPRPGYRPAVAAAPPGSLRNTLAQVLEASFLPPWCPALPTSLGALKHGPEAVSPAGLRDALDNNVRALAVAAAGASRSREDLTARQGVRL